MSLIKKREQDINFRKYLIKNLHGLLNLGNVEKKKEIISVINEDMFEYENYDIQDEVGKQLSKIHLSISEESLS